MTEIIDRLNGFLDADVTVGHLEEHEITLINDTIKYIQKLQSDLANAVDTQY
ncbi:hypothetical protein LCGC14_0742260 [marine sediment metagenome]|uniref:Uncharacterized protein n=1 Tax=marine sediment metagenome TaxID=412755 RepID=A0A0F9TDD5_9ZZZZ